MPKKKKKKVKKLTNREEEVELAVERKETSSLSKPYSSNVDRGRQKSDEREHVDNSTPTLTVDTTEQIEGSNTFPPLNPLLDAQKNFLSSLPSPPTTNENFFSDRHVTPEKRAEIWTRQSDVGEMLVNQYSWATPDRRALRILKQFSPIVEVGCGSNAYWCGLMKKVGIDVVGYDLSLDKGGKIDDEDGGRGGDEGKKRKKKKKRKRDDNVDENVITTKEGFRVRGGGPEVLSKEGMEGRTLFLCYPDEEEYVPPPNLDGSGDDDDDDDNEAGKYVPTSLGEACLEHYTGQYVIHVGELYPDTLSLDQAPWGRSSGPDFQQRLAAEFHCLLRVGLPSWLHVRDTISVWKRSERCAIVFEAEDDDDDDEVAEYRNVPLEERLPVDVAAPCLTHLLKEDGIGEGLGGEENEKGANEESAAPLSKIEQNGGDEGSKFKRKRLEEDNKGESRKGDISVEMTLKENQIGTDSHVICSEKKQVSTSPVPETKPEEKRKKLKRKKQTGDNKENGKKKESSGGMVMATKEVDVVVDGKGIVEEEQKEGALAESIPPKAEQKGEKKRKKPKRKKHKKDSADSIDDKIAEEKQVSGLKDGPAEEEDGGSNSYECPW